MEVGVVHQLDHGDGQVAGEEADKDDPDHPEQPPVLGRQSARSQTLPPGQLSDEGTRLSGRKI